MSSNNAPVNNAIMEGGEAAFSLRKEKSRKVQNPT